MTAGAATDAEILRLFYAEHWRVGTIASQLEVHPDVVRRVLGLGTRRAPTQPRPRLVDAFRPFALDVLQRFPRLRSTALFDMMRRRGFTGSARTVRSFVATIRPPRRREAYLMTETLPGEQAQVDWGYVGKLAVPGGPQRSAEPTRSCSGELTHPRIGDDGHGVGVVGLRHNENALVAVATRAFGAW